MVTLPMSIRMFEISQISSELDQMLFDIAANNMFVSIEKNKLKYKTYTVQKTKSGWTVHYQLSGHKKLLGEMFLKVSAFSLCKLHEKNKQREMKELTDKDATFQKNYLDSLYYKNTYSKTRDGLLRDTVLWRYEISHSRAKTAKQYIDNNFYALLR